MGPCWMSATEGRAAEVGSKTLQDVANSAFLTMDKRHLPSTAMVIAIVVAAAIITATVAVPAIIIAMVAVTHAMVTKQDTNRNRTKHNKIINNNHCNVHSLSLLCLLSLASLLFC